MAVIFSQKCDVGLVREINQDSVLCCSDSAKDIHLFVVADGMGGHTDGEKASNAITDGLKNWWNNFHPEDCDSDFRRIINAVQNCISVINSHIYEEYNKNTVCGSTCVVLLLYQGNYAVINAGDSHIYRKRGFRTEALMIDDTWENQVGIREAFSQAQLENHPNFGKLVNAIGTSADIKLSLKADVLEKKDTFLLCSDGLYKFCSEKKIKKIMSKFSSGNADACIDTLYSEVCNNGAGDNVSIIMVKYIV